jgi:hypothetical protein
LAQAIYGDQYPVGRRVDDNAAECPEQSRKNVVGTGFVTAGQRSRVSLALCQVGKPLVAANRQVDPVVASANAAAVSVITGHGDCSALDIASTLAAACGEPSAFRAPLPGQYWPMML